MAAFKAPGALGHKGYCGAGPQASDRVAEMGAASQCTQPGRHAFESRHPAPHPFEGQRLKGRWRLPPSLADPKVASR